MSQTKMILITLNLLVMTNSRMTKERRRIRLRRGMTASTRRQQKMAKMTTGKMMRRATKMERKIWLRKLKKREKQRWSRRVKRKRRRCPRWSRRTGSRIR